MALISLSVRLIWLLGDAGREMERLEHSRSWARTGKQPENEYQTCQQHLHRLTLGMGAPRLYGAPV